MSFIKDLQQCLCPAGNGVFTIYSGRQYREALQHKLYNGIGEAAFYQWQDKLSQLKTTDKPLILGIASDNGGGIMRGANWGPLFVRNALYNHINTNSVFDLGDVRVIPQLLLDEYMSTEIIKECKQWLYHDANSLLPASPLSITEYVTKQIYQIKPDAKIFGMGGDHSCSYPLVKAYLEYKKSQGKRCALIHFDAHTDIMTNRMGVPICFGSWTYHILKDLPSEDCLVQIGIRSSSKTRDYWHSQYKIKQYWSYDVLENGADVVAVDIVEYLQRKNIDELYVTFDIDALDSSIASCTGTPETEGLSLDDVKCILHRLNSQFNITGADIMEVAPFVCHDQANALAAQRSTLEVAADVSQLLLMGLADFK